MGDRFYAQQKAHKPVRRLKIDIIKEVDEVLGDKVEGLDRLTIKSLDSLIAVLKWRLDDD